MSIGTFLSAAKKHLQQALKNNGTASFVIGNESADLDSITCALVYGYLQSSRLEARWANEFVIPVTNIPASELSLRPELAALLGDANLKPSDLITLDDLGKPPLGLNKTSWTLVDHNGPTGIVAEHYADCLAGVIDHHDDEHKVPLSAKPRIIEKTGSCNSHVVNYCRESWDTISSGSSSVGAALGQSSDGITDDTAYTSTWDAQLAKLSLGSILIDTFNMRSEDKITDHDRKAVRYLEARINASPKIGKDYDRDAFFNGINSAKSSLDALSLRDILRKDYKQWSEGDMTLGISSVVQPVEYLTKKVDGDFVQALVEFAKSRELQLYAVMTASTTDSGGFARQLLLLSLEEGKPKQAVQRFVQQCSNELQLQDSALDVSATSAQVPWMHFWDQNEVKASRKRVGPLLREAMQP